MRVVRNSRPTLSDTSFPVLVTTTETLKAGVVLACEEAEFGEKSLPMS